MILAPAKRRMGFVIATALVASSLIMTTTRRDIAHAAPSKPNIVIVMTDDQRWDTVTSRYMPHLTAILSRNPSITYTNAFVPNSLCCPSRASTLTGDYSHATGVYGNLGPWGGFHSFTHRPQGRSISAINDTTTLAVDLHGAGYRTALIGKYLNGYDSETSGYVPPGWDRWFEVPTGAFYDYWATDSFPWSTDGARRNLHFGTKPGDYITRVLSARAIDFVERSSSKPFFLYYAPTAPHAPAIPDPRDVDRFSLQGYARPPSYGRTEAGAPNFIRDLPWNATLKSWIDTFHRRQLDSMYGVDRSIGQLWEALPTNTLVVFMSDNGISWGEHRWPAKMLPYNEDLRIPMMLVGKRLSAPLPKGRGRCRPVYQFAKSCDGRIVLNVDVLPTLEAKAGITSGHRIEGLDMLGSVRRSEFVLEHWNRYVPRDDAHPPTYCGVRSDAWMYVRYNGEEEPVREGLYDERASSFETNNLAETDPTGPRVAAELQTMRRRARTLCSVRGGIYPNDWPYR